MHSVKEYMVATAQNMPSRTAETTSSDGLCIPSLFVVMSPLVGNPT